MHVQQIITIGTCVGVKKIVSLLWEEDENQAAAAAAANNIIHSLYNVGYAL